MNTTSRDTSLAAYRTIKENNLLSERRLEVLEILAHFGPLTAHEVVSVGRKKNPLANQTGWNARLSELESMGVVKTVGEKLNEVSNVLNMLWDVTGSLPTKPEKKETNGAKVKRLTAENIRLRAALAEIKAYGCIPDSVVASKAL